MSGSDSAAPRSRPPVESPAPRNPERSERVAIPTPEDLGIARTARSDPSAAPSAAELDWSLTRRHLNDIGAVRFQLERLGTGGSRFSCWLPGDGGNRLVYADGGSEAEAVRLCLEQARKHVSQRR